MPSGFGLEISLFDFNVGDRLGGTDEEKKEWISSSLKEDLVNILIKIGGSKEILMDQGNFPSRGLNLHSN